MLPNKYVSLTICLLYFCSHSWGQPPSTHQKQHYSSPEGKLYWPADLPMYIFVSSTPEATDAQQLASKNPAHGNPFYLDTEGINWVRTNWAVNRETRQTVVPQQEVLFPVYRDGTAPKTKVQFTQAQRFVSAEVPYYGPQLRVSATAEDALSGVANIYVSLDGGPYQPYKDTLSLSKNARHTLSFYAVDHVGNVETPQSFVFEVDISPPATQYSLDGEYSRNTLSVRASITLAATDASVGVQQIYYQIDGGPARKYRSGVPIQELTDGQHTLTYYAQDKVGNQEPAKEYKFYLDKTPPEVVASIIGDQYQNRGRVFISDRTTVELTATDNEAGVRTMVYSIDGGPEKEYDGPFPLKKSEGNHVVTYYAVDKVGNGFRGEFREEYGGRQALSLDMEAPEVSFTFSGSRYDSRDTTFITSATAISLLAEDEDSGVKQIGYKINSGPGQPYEGPFTLEEEGIYHVDFYSTDVVNNRNTAEFFFIVDNTGPEIEEIFSAEPIGSIDLDDEPAPLQVFAKGLTIYLGATDAVVNTKEIWYSLNDTAPRLYTKPIRIETPGINQVSITAKDELGNSSTSKPMTFFVK